VWPALVEQFHAENPDIIVEYEMIPLAQYYDRLLVAASSGARPTPPASRSGGWATSSPTTCSNRSTASSPPGRAPPT
jgi:hypothetical protein